MREAWMSVLQHELPGSRVLDLFAGSGALGLEALSRGAGRVTFVEHAAAALRTLRENVRRLGAGGEVEITRGDAIAFARGLPADAFDVALADPPYGAGHAAELATIYRDTTFARVLCIEHGADESMPDLPGMRTRRYGDSAFTTYTAVP